MTYFLHKPRKVRGITTCLHPKYIPHSVSRIQRSPRFLCQISFVKIPWALKTQPWNPVDGGVLAHFLLLAEAIYPSAKPLCHVVSPPQLSQSGSQPQARWCLISLHIPIDCHHHPWANSYSYSPLVAARLFSSSLILSPREQPADCHKALMQVLTTPGIMLLRHGTEPCADLARSHRARPEPGTQVARHSVGPGV